MSFTEAVFRVVDVSGCPYYQKGDEFKITGNALLLEHNKGSKFISTVIIDMPSKRRECRTLISELTKILVEHERVDRIPDRVMSCGMCHGEIKLEHKKGTAIALVEDIKQHGTDAATIASILSNFSIFKTLDDSSLRDFVSLLRLKKYAPGDTIISKGDLGKNLYIILAGLVNVADEDGISITKLRNGEVFGEMSLISGDPVGATIKVLEPTTVLFIKGQDFLKVLNRFPSLQMYFARLLSRRLAKSNVMISKEFSSGMTGTLSQMPPVELLQTLNYNQKTGTLKLNLSKGPATILFRGGAIVQAVYGPTMDKFAFFSILGEKQGRFQFVPGLTEQEMALPELGMFMELLMEGLRKMDEAVRV
ncbi:MAG: cyclic nucleotide-binding domain-containing protein [Desulfatitalea sp.]|nr:cyclic nucleotide-binding domain-containing protein [Desulfatitalea sp.]